MQNLKIPQGTASMPTQEQAQPQVANISFTGDGSLAPLFTPEIQYWSKELTRWTKEHNLDPNLAATVMQIESCGNPDARSSAGAASLFQVMPFHFLVYENAFDPETNALRGMNYLAKSLETAGGDARLALAGYNGGIGVIARAESTWPAETIRYAYWGSGIYEDATQKASESGRLNEWLAAGGASLCRQARERLGISSQ
jgi:soluble lytic murein transglycosylase-like protein